MRIGRPPADFELTRRVYADIARHPLPFSTPDIFDVEDHEGALVACLRHVPGRARDEEALAVLRAVPGVAVGVATHRNVVTRGTDHRYGRSSVLTVNGPVAEATHGVTSVVSSAARPASHSWPPFSRRSR